MPADPDKAPGPDKARNPGGVRNDVRNPNEVSGFEFIVYPRTGVQICRSFPIPGQLQEARADLWAAATREAARQKATQDRVLELVGHHVACLPGLEAAGKATGWVRAAPGEYAFYRLLKAGDDLVLDLVIDTERGAGAGPWRFPCLLYAGPLGGLGKGRLGRVLRPSARLCRRYVPARFHVTPGVADSVGTLILDFGNSGCSFNFAASGEGAIQGEVLAVHNPFDPAWATRPEQETNILQANVTFLQVEPDTGNDPWIVMGTRAGELIRQEPAATYVSAPKKYVRYWPEHLQNRQPQFPVRGVLGELGGQQSSHYFVRQSLRHMFQCVLASLTNPGYRSASPLRHPQFDQVMVTYPLTWRDADRKLFRQMVQETAERQFQLREPWKSQFRVDLVCSEPVAIAAYILWEAFYHFGTENSRLLSSTLGNDAGAPQARVLVVDVGGGSTDIAVVQVDWDAAPAGEGVSGGIDVKFRILESMRFNRAGDRLSHLIATAIREFLRGKYDVRESLHLQGNSVNIDFNDRRKRLAVSKIFGLAEAAKAAIASAGVWALSREEETALTDLFRTLVVPEVLERRRQGPPRLVITDRTLREWVRADHQRPEANNEPGFMDIFLYLEELGRSLAAEDRRPHLVVLSGRTCRMPFIRDFVADYMDMPLHRVRTLEDLWPSSLRLLGHENMDKLAVVCGAQRFRFGGNIRFFSLPEEKIFNRFIGTLRETPLGLKLNDVLVRQGDPRPRTIRLKVPPGPAVRIGHSFREDGLVQILAELTNRSEQVKEVHLHLEDDFTVQMKSPVEGIVFIEWVPGGARVIVDNFNDTGDIDGNPKDFIRRLVLNAVPIQEWLRPRLDEPARGEPVTP